MCVCPAASAAPPAAIAHIDTVVGTVATEAAVTHIDTVVGTVAIEAAEPQDVPEPAPVDAVPQAAPVDSQAPAAATPSKSKTMINLCLLLFVLLPALLAWFVAMDLMNVRGSGSSWLSLAITKQLWSAGAHTDDVDVMCVSCGAENVVI